MDSEQNTATSPTSPRPLVSIIIPAYNSARWISAAIESVLCQSYPHWELIIIDDASSDETANIASQYAEREYAKKGGSSTISENEKIRLLQNPANLGISKTRNLGLHEARGTLIAMLDSDDIWLDEHKLEKQVEAFEKATIVTSVGTKNATPRPLGIVGTWMTTIDENSTPIRQLRFAEDDASIRSTILYKNHIMQSSVLFLKEAALDAGGYDENLRTMEDHDLWLKIGETYSFAVLPIYALGYRIHSGGITHRKRRNVALSELRVIWRHRHSYPGAAKGVLKGLARLVLSIF